MIDYGATLLKMFVEDFKKVGGEYERDRAHLTHRFKNAKGQKLEIPFNCEERAVVKAFETPTGDLNAEQTRKFLYQEYINALRKEVNYIYRPKEEWIRPKSYKRNP